MRHTTDKSITTSSPIPSTQTNEIVSHDDWPINCENKEQGLYGDPVDCTKFHYCQISYKQGQADPIISRHDFVNFNSFLI